MRTPWSLSYKLLVTLISTHIGWSIDHFCGVEHRAVGGVSRVMFKCDPTLFELFDQRGLQFCRLGAFFLLFLWPSFHRHLATIS